MNKIICGDCLEVMKGLPDKSINLIIADPPYNIGKADWDKIPNYIEWLGNRLLEMQRVLKDNGSFYLFHNDFLQMVEIQDWINKNSKFVFKQLIVWNQRFENMEWTDKNGRKRTYKDYSAILTNDGLRNYKKMAEYILFYTLQDETGLTTVKFDTNNFSTLRRYFKELQEFIGVNKRQIMDRMGQKADHCFRWESSQWDLPTKETYSELINKLDINIWSGFREYESLRQEYESLRYTFNNQKSHHSVWNYELAEQCGHITPKPIPLIKNILKHSSNEGDRVLIPFVGSGNDCIACKELKRNYIGIENKLKYVEIARRRIKAIPELLFYEEE